MKKALTKWIKTARIEKGIAQQTKNYGGKMAEKTISTSSPSVTSAIFGTFDANVTSIENAFKVKIINRPLSSEIGDCIVVSGDSDGVNGAYEVLMYLNKMVEMDSIITEQTVCSFPCT